MKNTSTIYKGDIVTPDRVIIDGAICVENGQITSVGGASDLLNQFKDYRVVDFSGQYILPGGIDAHVHCFSDPREGFHAGTKSAAAGGITTIIDMPYDDGNPVNNLPRVYEKISEIENNSFVDVALHGTIAPGTFGEDLPRMVEAGVCGFKVSLFETDKNRFPRINNAELFEILKLAKENQVVVGVHAEDGEIIYHLIEKFSKENKIKPIDHCRSRPPLSETLSVSLGVQIAKTVGAPFHIFHASLPESIHIVGQANNEGANITVETCPHYLMFSEEDMATLGPRGKINPPLRSKKAVQELWDLLANGKIDMFTSDHAPWRLDKKSDNKNIFNNSSGAPGVQLLYPILLSEGFSKGQLGLLTIAKLIAENPAKRFNLGHRKGKLKAGYDADFVIYDPEKRWEVKAKDQFSLAGWTPYEGLKMLGRIQEVYLRGEKVADKNEVVGSANYGEFVRGINGTII